MYWLVTIICAVAIIGALALVTGGGIVLCRPLGRCTVGGDNAADGCCCR
jgi:hypothetical protein